MNHTTKPMKNIFNAKEAVTEYFEGTISYTKLLQDFKQGKIPGKKLSARKILFKREALDRWFNEQENNQEKIDNQYGELRKLKE